MNISVENTLKKSLIRFVSKKDMSYLCLRERPAAQRRALDSGHHPRQFGSGGGGK